MMALGSLRKNGGCNNLDMYYTNKLTPKYLQVAIFLNYSILLLLHF